MDIPVFTGTHADFLIIVSHFMSYDCISPSLVSIFSKIKIIIDSILLGKDFINFGGEVFCVAAFSVLCRHKFIIRLADIYMIQALLLPVKV
jgi:hypothetical protein